MYYSADQTTPSFSNQPEPEIYSSFDPIVRKSKWKLYAVAVAAIAVVVTGVWWYGEVQTALRPEEPVKAAATPTPTPESKPEVAGVTFGDILNKKRDYSGWLAGTDRGNIVIVNPDNGEMNTLLQVKDEWHGPISEMIWSPNRSKIAFLVMSEREAEGFSKDPISHAKQMGLGSVPSPQAFPYGNIAILDVATKQLTKTSVEVRNTPKSIVWLDDSRMAAVESSLVAINLSDSSVKTLAGGGVTDSDTQLQSPLVWHAEEETLYFTKIEKSGKYSTRLVVGLEVPTGKLEKLATVKSGTFDEAANSLGVDLALSVDGDRLGVMGDEGLGYITLDDGGVHYLPYQDEWLWMKESVLSDMVWLSPSRLAFKSMDSQGSNVWGVWDIPNESIMTFGKGALDGSWGGASGRLALVQASGKEIGILTPNWENTSKSTINLMKISWQGVSW